MSKSGATWWTPTRSSPGGRRHGPPLHLFASPDKDLDWSTRGRGPPFLQRVYRLVESHLDSLRRLRGEAPMEHLREKKDRDLKRRIHYTIDRVTRDIEEEKQFNTAVARLMELSNDLGSYSPSSEREWRLFREGVSPADAAHPHRPHICEELWEMTGNEGFVSERPWPPWTSRPGPTGHRGVPGQRQGEGAGGAPGRHDPR